MSKSNQAAYTFDQNLNREKIKPEEMARFATDKVEPLKDQTYGNRYWVAAHLNDGTYLPCLVLQSRLELCGFGESRAYLLEYNLEKYDSKAVAGIAHKYQSPTALFWCN